MRAIKYVFSAAVATSLLLVAIPGLAAGGSWSNPVYLSPENQNAGSPQLAVDSNGLATAIWLTDGVIQSSTSQSGGNWSDPVNLSTADQIAESPQITVGATGVVTAIWVLSNGMVQSRQKLPTDLTWSDPVNLSATGATAQSPQITTDANGLLTAIWRISYGSNPIIEARHKLPGETDWETAEPLSLPGQEAGGPKLTLDSSGLVTALWSRSDGQDNYIQSRTSLDGSAWSPIEDLTAPSEGLGAYGHQVSTNPDGLAVAIWRRYDGNNYVFQARTSQSGGSWSPAETLSATGQNAEALQIAVDSLGFATAAWIRFDGTTNIVQARRLQSDGTWSDTVNFGDAGELYNPQVQLVVDSTGLVTAIWPKIDGDQVLYSSSLKNGGSWSTPLRVSNLGVGAFDHAVKVDSTGRVIAIWRNYEGDYSRVMSSVFSYPASTPLATTPTLAKTGAEVDWLLLGSLITVVAGAGFFAFGRRKRTA